MTKAAVAAAPANSILIRGTEVPVRTEYLEQHKLLFYADNPRVYSVVHGKGEVPTQEQIQKRLLDMEHVRELIQDIRLNKGLIEPLIVKDGTLEVLEGNSRLAAYRFLAKTDPVKWGYVKCTILPADIDEALVFALLGQFHIRGKKDWVPYEQAGFLYRRFRKHHADLKALALEIGISATRVKHLVATYQFMVDNDEDNINRWSYYDEYLKSNKIKKARARYSDRRDRTSRRFTRPAPRYLHRFESVGEVCRRFVQLFRGVRCSCPGRRRQCSSADSQEVQGVDYSTASRRASPRLRQENS
jgi:hypothetical protein